MSNDRKHGRCSFLTPRSFITPRSYMSVYFDGICAKAGQHCLHASCSLERPMKRSVATAMNPFGVTHVRPMAADDFDLSDRSRLDVTVPSFESSHSRSVQSPMSTTLPSPQSRKGCGMTSANLASAILFVRALRKDFGLLRSKLQNHHHIPGIQRGGENDRIPIPYHSIVS